MSSLRRLGRGAFWSAAEVLTGGHWDELAKQWVDSLTLKPLTESIGKIKSGAGGHIFSVRLTAPEVLLIVVR